jgi:hypothetical protein
MRINRPLFDQGLAKHNLEVR